MISNSPSTYKYDAENRLVTTGGSTYYYDGDGSRVGKVNGSSGTLYWRGMGGDPLSESSLTGTSQEEYIFFGGTRVARRDVSGGAVHYYFSDHLGSHGVVENATGTSCEQDIDYYPYGGVVHDYCPNVTQHYRFTGKERDSESGLDNFGARYHASSLGRFMTPDWADDADPIPYADLRNPQSLNLYAYVQNNPLSSTDDDGHMCIVSASSGGDVCNVGNNIFKMNQGQEYGGVSKDPYTLTIQVWEQFEGTWWSTKVVTAAEWFATLGLGAAVRGGAPFAIAASYFISPPNKYAPDTVDFNKNASKIPHDAADPNGAKAPGKPGAAEGFKDPKTGPKWGKAPNGKNGWIDAQGNVWVPTGQGALAHGGPHWDVQNEDGTFGGSKYPGGFSR
jgi:RHS repeat-associated protein